ncbi:hypothetical protein N7532_000685 [Penicillium argentinense]|uniref:Uncharacterized protein n=1 Tax=Penicillium argentinense TaxID=1131581 RepID=A0A9W9G6N1_9EURO|nr:uncharacterized protein N7532_000685 [Penicillium argentinense]KAJ5112640.1 hypothetical protein N7532_000685 [Penicillium argentinense]
MQLTTIVPVLLSSLSLTAAAPQEVPATWKATDLDIGCSPGGCSWRFNITGAASENTPRFHTHCEGIAPNATLCTDKNITARVKPLTYPKFNIWVQHQWHIIEDETDQHYWQSGDANVTDAQTRFQIKPDQFYGVA